MEASATAAVEPTTASAVESSTAVRREAATAAICAARVVADRTVPIVAAAAVVSSPTVVAVAVVSMAVVSATVVAMVVEPGTSADKDATDEPARSVISVRRTGIGGIAVIAIRTNRGRTVTIAVACVYRPANADADCHLLRVGERRAQHANRQ
jgi:hypothetical protein